MRTHRSCGRAVGALIGPRGFDERVRRQEESLQMADSCSHLDSIEITELPDEIPGCEDCLKIGGRWLHLRMCETCGHIACCDSSPNRHATAHASESGHPIVRSAEPGEDWSWCYVDEVLFVVEA
jgi:ubiquitin-hydrolase Zn-finger-containing protein